MIKDGTFKKWLPVGAILDASPLHFYLSLESVEPSTGWCEIVIKSKELYIQHVRVMQGVLEIHFLEGS